MPLLMESGGSSCARTPWWPVEWSSAIASCTIMIVRPARWEPTIKRCNRARGAACSNPPAFP